MEHFEVLKERIDAIEKLAYEQQKDIDKRIVVLEKRSDLLEKLLSDSLNDQP